MTSNQEWMEYLAPAARAAGVVGQAVERWHGGRLIAVIEREDGTFWIPHIDMGHALWLAVKLDLHVQCDFKEEESKVYVYGGWLGNGIEEEPGELDKFGATCRAIVRAAAEIGKAGAQ